MRLIKCDRCNGEGIVQVTFHPIPIAGNLHGDIINGLYSRDFCLHCYFTVVAPLFLTVEKDSLDRANDFLDKYDT